METNEISFRILELVAKNNNIPRDDYEWWIEIYEPDLTELLPNLLDEWGLTEVDDNFCELIANGDETLLFQLYGESEWWWKINEEIDSYFNKL